MKWINVNNGVPNTARIIIVNSKTYGVMVGYYRYSADNDIMWCCITNNYEQKFLFDSKDITHWMELPEMEAKYEYYE